MTTLTTQNTEAQTDVSASKNELNPGFEGETITLKEAVDISGKSKVTVLKVIKDQKVPSVGQVRSQKRGRPANLYERAVLLAALHSS